MGKFIKDNLHWIVVVIGIVAILAYKKATTEPEDVKKDDNKQ